MFKNINKKALVISIIIPLIIGGIGALLGGSMDKYKELILPSFAPPGFLFPLVWTILYILMGISSYIIYESKDKKEERKSALTVYAIQLVINGLWTLIFFRFGYILFAFWWLILLILFVLTMIYKFYKVKPIAGILQIPYLLWIIFAAILNYSIYLLN